MNRRWNGQWIWLFWNFIFDLKSEFHQLKASSHANQRVGKKSIQKNKSKKREFKEMRWDVSDSILWALRKKTTYKRLFERSSGVQRVYFLFVLDFHWVASKMGACECVRLKIHWNCLMKHRIEKSIFFCAKYLCELCNFDVNGLFLSRTWINDREHAVMALLGFYSPLAKHTTTDTHRRCCSLCVVIILLGARIKFKSENKSPQL